MGRFALGFINNLFLDHPVLVFVKSFSFSLSLSFVTKTFDTGNGGLVIFLILTSCWVFFLSTCDVLDVIITSYLSSQLYDNLFLDHPALVSCKVSFSRSLSLLLQKLLIWVA